MRARHRLLYRRFAFVPALLVLGACTTPDKVALKEYAPKSSDADIKAVSLGATDNDTFDPQRIGTEFPDPTKQVAVWYRWNGADSGKKVDIHWSKGGVVVLEQTDTLLEPSGQSAYVLKMAGDSKLPTGDYQVELLEGGVAVTKIPFKVGAGGSGGSEVAVTREDTGVSEETQAAAAPAAEPSEDQAGAAAEPAAEATTPEPPSASAPPSASGAVLASNETEWPGVVVELTELVRKGKTLNARLRFTNKGTTQVRPDFYYRDTYVLDEDNKKYEVLKDDKGGYLGSVSSGYNYWWGEKMEPGATRQVWMRFAPPPAGVKSVTVQVGTLDPFDDVPIRN